MHGYMGTLCVWLATLACIAQSYFECWDQAVLGEIDGMDLILESQISELCICS